MDASSNGAPDLPCKRIDARLDRILIDIFGVDLAELAKNQQITALREWDSLNHIQFVVALEHAFGIEFSGDEIAGMQTIENVQTLILARVSPAPVAPPDGMARAQGEAEVEEYR
jgi:acyl carrier protein